MTCRTLFSGSDSDSVGDAQVPLIGDSPPSGDSNLLDSVLLAEWEDRAEQGLFRYDVTACPTQLVPGAYGFIAQCNEGRASKKRPTEFQIDQVSCEGVLIIVLQAMFYCFKHLQFASAKKLCLAS